MKVLIACPTMGTIKTQTAASLFNLRGDNVGIACTESSLVFDARNGLTKRALDDPEIDAVLWVDSDMVFPADMLEKMIRDDKDIVTALCFRRREPFSPCIYKKLRYGIGNQVESEVYEDYPDGLFEVDGCGFGAILVKTNVMRDVVDRYLYPFNMIPGLGEDLSFCVKAKNCGYTIWCDSSIIPGHIAETIVNDKTYETFKKNKQRSSRQRH